MSPWICASLVFGAGCVGGIVNALLTDNGFILPTRLRAIVCPGFLSNVLIGGLAAFSSWALYGSGAGVDLARAAASATERTEISLTFGALAGAFFVGVAGARWITNEADKRLLKEGAKVVAQKGLPPDQCERIFDQSPRRALEVVQQA